MWNLVDPREHVVTLCNLFLNGPRLAMGSRVFFGYYETEQKGKVPALGLEVSSHASQPKRV